MANTIYDPDAKIEIGRFIKEATEKTAIFIPDLQRPYVWNPDQVILLIDSIFKGWPFGSLLTWQIYPKYDENNRLVEGIPYRKFYTRVSRVEGVASEEATERDLPSSRDGDLMILDGQQRLQSLILALGNTHGLCLYDYQWDASLPVPRGMRKNTNRYSTAFLYLNVVKFMEEMLRHNNICSLISLENILEWVIIKRDDHVGNRGEIPLPILQNCCDKNFYLRLSDIWDKADPAHNDEDNDLKPAMKDLLESKIPQVCLQILYQSFGGEDAVIKNLAKFLHRLCEISQVQIRCLKIRSFESRARTPEQREKEKEEYDDAIVNIFTRLNTAGRTLTREEITYAWLKQGWKATDEYPKAGNLVSGIQQGFAEWQLEADNVIGALASVWSVFEKEGAILKEKDLLRGEKVRPMAAYLSQLPIANTLRDISQRITDIIRKEELTSILMSDSFNAVIVAWNFYLLGEFWRISWESKNRVLRMESDDIRKKIDFCFLKFMTRWIAVPSIGGCWATGAVKYMQNLTSILAKSIDPIKGADSVSVMLQTMESVAKKLLDTATDAAKRELRLTLTERKVYLYKSRLIIWQRLTKQRAQYRELTFVNADTKSSPELQVDHIISYAGWEAFIDKCIENQSLKPMQALELFSNDSPETFSSRASQMQQADIKNLAMGFINNIGNCSILNGNYNSSKDKMELGEFMQTMHEFNPDSQGKIKVNKQQWCEQMLLNDIFLSPFSKGYSIEEIVAAIKEREKNIYEDLERYVLGIDNFDALY